MMDSHATEYQLQELLDNELHGEEFSLVQLHVESCPNCQRALVSARALLRQLKSLPTEAREIPFTRTAPRHLARAFFFRYPAVGTAAAIAIFAAGTLVGTWIAPLSHTVAVNSGDAGSESQAEEVQHLGTQYVTAIANWRRKESSTPGAEQGREAAFAALYGAAYELQKLEPEDPHLSNVVRSIGGLRNQVSKKNHRPQKEDTK